LRRLAVQGSTAKRCPKKHPKHTVGMSRLAAMYSPLGGF